MRRVMIVRFLLIVGLLSCAVPLSAQSLPTPRWTFGATVGGGGTWDDEGSIGKGALVGGFAQWRWLERTSLEASADVLRHNRGGEHFQAHGHTNLFGASIVQFFGAPAARAYVNGGIVVGAHSGTAGFPSENLVNDTSGTHHGFTFGGGFAFRAGGVEMGPMVRIALMSADDDSDPASLAMVGFRIGFAR